jgi:subtilisin family serine protease
MAQEPRRSAVKAKKPIPGKTIVMSSSKILPEVRQRMGRDKSVDVIIGREDFVYIDPVTNIPIEPRDLEARKREIGRSKKKLDIEKHKEEVSMKEIEQELRRRFDSRTAAGLDIQRTDFFLSVTLGSDMLEEIAGEVKNRPGIKGISRIWLNKKTEALLDKSNQTIKAQAARSVFKVEGEGIVWAVLDTGIDADNRWIKDAVIKPPHNFTAEPDGDQNGHGTHVAGIIASRSKDYPGIAPKARLYDMKVLDKDGRGTDFAVIRAMEEVRRINARGRDIVIHGVNISLGSTPEVGSYGVGWTPICQEANRLMLSGVLVCVAAGNDGYKIIPAFLDQTHIEYFRTFFGLTIADPGNAEEVITVGSVHKENPHSYGISYFSAKGPTGDGRRKPDVVAPGEKIRSLGLAASRKLDGVEMSGTSMSAPHVSGALALFLCAKREFIGQPLKVKDILMRSCTDLKRNEFFQGSGLIDIFRAIQAV